MKATRRAVRRAGRGESMRRVTLRLVALVAALAALSGIAVPSVSAARVQADYHLDLYREGVFVTQYRWTWCVGASSQMMLNIINGTSNTTFRRQKKLVTYAM